MKRTKNVPYCILKSTWETFISHLQACTYDCCTFNKKLIIPHTGFIKQTWAKYSTLTPYSTITCWLDNNSCKSRMANQWFTIISSLTQVPFTRHTWHNMTHDLTSDSTSNYSPLIHTLFDSSSPHLRYKDSKTRLVDEGWVCQPDSPILVIKATNAALSFRWNFFFVSPTDKQLYSLSSGNTIPLDFF